MGRLRRRQRRRRHPPRRDGELRHGVDVEPHARRNDVAVRDELDQRRLHLLQGGLRHERAGVERQSRPRTPRRRRAASARAAGRTHAQSHLSPQENNADPRACEIPTLRSTISPWSGPGGATSLGGAPEAPSTALPRPAAGVSRLALANSSRGGSNREPETRATTWSFPTLTWSTRQPMGSCARRGHMKGARCGGGPFCTATPST